MAQAPQPPPVVPDTPVRSGSRRGTSRPTVRTASFSNPQNQQSVPATPVTLRSQPRPSSATSGSRRQYAARQPVTPRRTSSNARRRGSARWGRRPQVTTNEQLGSQGAPTADSTFTVSRRRKPHQAVTSRPKQEPQHDIRTFKFGSKLSSNNIGKQADITTNTGGNAGNTN